VRGGSALLQLQRGTLAHGADQLLGKVQDQLQDGNKKVDEERKQREQKREYRLQNGVYRVHRDSIANGSVEQPDGRV